MSGGDETTGVGEVLVRVEGLRVGFGGGRSGFGARSRASERGPAVVDGVSFEVRAGRSLAIVGESGSGKSVTARALVGLVGPGSWVTADALEVDGISMLGASAAAWRRVRGGRIGLVVQDALVSLDPLRPIGREIADALRLHTTLSEAGRRARVEELLESVGMPEPRSRMRQRSGELSGGLRQRALIASALAASPALLIADEPTTALDSTVQAQILGLFETIKARGTGLLFISHDLAVVSRIADDVLVMRGGRVVEAGTVEAVLGDPRSSYTKALLRAVPAGVARGVSLVARGGSRVARGGSPVARGGSSGVDIPSESRPASASPTPARPTSASEGMSTPLLPGSGEARVTSASEGMSTPLLPGSGEARVTSASEGMSTPLLPGSGEARVTSASEGMSTPLLPGSGEAWVLEVAGVSKTFGGLGGRKAVDGVSLGVRAGTTVGLVGESGSGKTTVARIVLGLTAPDEGSVRLGGEAWVPGRERDRRARRASLGAVYQDALSSFDPRLTVQQILSDALRGQGSVEGLLEEVGLEARVASARPLQLSGGQRQRVSIARALAPQPSVIVLDEPVSALDVSIQAQILDLLDALQRERGVAYLFISHDLGVVQHMSDELAVMKDGRIVEQGPAASVFAAPSHAYTRALLAAAPVLRTREGGALAW
ncbi:dipeptide ABC transporter ATP-binding protein [Herbiconiux sp. CPCC 203406]|uniref:dipeptide ABC transporter ATP-binding protein n=1 Tax=Herbiconiux oxytropis TaxID=2970915 RepID=UPI00217EE8A4|nr:dipeptide ABC transporter ATP-binding protein [Herbiconiux oxytropis]MCS5722607.1 dipeptide ABC transporter ATP-binding protein [Herbiconiux oxytropis]